MRKPALGDLHAPSASGSLELPHGSSINTVIWVFLLVKSYRRSSGSSSEVGCHIHFNHLTVLLLQLSWNTVEVDGASRVDHDPMQNLILSSWAGDCDPPV